MSPCVEVWQSGHGALEVVLLHPGGCWIATGDDDGVLKLDGACPPVIITIMIPSLTLMTLYSLCIVCQGEAGCGAGVGGRQDLRAGLSAEIRSPHQQEASRRSPAGVVLPHLLELVTLLPARASQGDAGGAGSSTVSTACHQPILSVVKPGGGERRH